MESSAPSPQRAPIWTPNFIWASLSTFAVFTGFYFLLPTLPLFTVDIGGNESHVGWIIGLFTIAALVFRPWIGRALDHHGRKGILLAGLGIFVLASLAYNWAASLVFLFALRVIHGLGWGGSTTAASTLIADLAPPARRGEVMGYYGIFINLAMAVGPALGIVIMQKWGFPVLFYSSTLLALAALLLAAMVREPALPPRPPGDKGALISREALFPSAVIFFLALTYGGVVSFIPLFATDRGIANPGLFFTVYSIVLIGVRPLAGRISDRVERAKVILPGLLLVVGAMVTLAFAHSLPLFLMAAVLNGLGFGAVQPALMAFTVERAGTEGRGAAMATFTSAFDLGIGLGSIFLGMVLTSGGYLIMYLTAALAALAGFGVFLAGYGKGKESVVRENSPQPSP